jgi:HK97 gp10 family phage protein
MPARFSLDLTGFDEFLEKLQAIGENVDAAAGQALEAGAAVAVAGMRARVAVDTGNLQEHIKAGPVELSGNTSTIEVGIISADGKTVRYAMVQEYGSASVTAHPYIRPTMGQDKGKIRAAMRAELKGILGGRA